MDYSRFERIYSINSKLQAEREIGHFLAHSKGASRLLPVNESALARSTNDIWRVYSRCQILCICSTRASNDKRTKKTAVLFQDRRLLPGGQPSHVGGPFDDISRTIN